MSVDIEETIRNMGYNLKKDRGLTVNSIRKNKRETILSVSSASSYNICWLAKAINDVFKERKHGN